MNRLESVWSELEIDYGFWMSLIFADSFSMTCQDDETDFNDLIKLSADQSSNECVSH